MKKLFIFAFMAIGFALSAQAQEISKNALGIRVGDGDGFGTEISYQRYIGGNNRLEFDLGWRDHKYYDAFRLTGLYQWVWNIDGGFNWYAGAGAGIGSVDVNDDFPGNDDSNVFAYVAGDLGIEYNFDIPLQLSLDVRPELGFNDYNDDLGLDLALGIRYQF